jgi:hypothetical protein
MIADIDYADACGDPIPERTSEMRLKLKKIVTEQYFR